MKLNLLGKYVAGLKRGEAIVSVAMLVCVSGPFGFACVINKVMLQYIM